MYSPIIRLLVATAATPTVLSLTTVAVTVRDGARSRIVYNFDRIVIVIAIRASYFEGVDEPWSV